MAEWFAASTPEEQETLLQVWPDAPIENLMSLRMILETARDQVMSYAPEPDPEAVEVTLPEPVTVPVDSEGVTGTIVVRRELGNMLRLKVSLTNESGSAITDWWGVPIIGVDNPDLVPPYQAANNFGSNGWLYTPDSGAGVFGHSGGTWANGETYTFDLLSNSAEEDPEPEYVVPQRYVYAQLEQAKRLWMAGLADENGNIGTETFSFTPRPLDKTIRAIIRPQSGVADAL